MTKVIEDRNIEVFIRSRIEQRRSSYREISEELKALYPSRRGLSERNIRRYCKRFKINKLSLVDDNYLDHLVCSNINRVGGQYGRKTMAGLLAAQGFRIGENRIAKSLQRVSPSNYASRTLAVHRLMNPAPYVANYFGEKLHIDQNEKVNMFGVTHILGIDGFSKKIVGLCTMPIKNTVLIYEHFFRSIILEFGLWSQVRVDHGTEWAILLHVQSQLGRFRRDSSRPPYLQTSSKQNHVVERLWVEVNSRVNYPVKKLLLKMIEDCCFNIDDSMVQFCISWFSIHVCNVGLKLFVKAWNEHPLPGSRACRTSRGTPNQRMLQDCRTVTIPPTSLPTSAQATLQYRQCGGQITEANSFGEDPLVDSPEKLALRYNAFKMRFRSFDFIFHELMKCNEQPFIDGLSYFIDLTYRLSHS